MEKRKRGNDCKETQQKATHKSIYGVCEAEGDKTCL